MDQDRNSPGMADEPFTPVKKPRKVVISGFRIYVPQESPGKLVISHILAQNIKLKV